MYRINLSNLHTSEIKYDVCKYSDGHQQVKILGYEAWPAVDKGETEFKKILDINLPNEIEITAHLNNFLDIEILCCTVSSLRELGIETLHLKTPYILGSESDKKVQKGSNNYLKTVTGPIINSLRFKSVRVIDFYSRTLEMCIDNFKPEDKVKQ